MGSGSSSSSSTMPYNTFLACMARAAEWKAQPGHLREREGLGERAREATWNRSLLRYYVVRGPTLRASPKALGALAAAMRSARSLDCHESRSSGRRQADKGVPKYQYSATVLGAHADAHSREGFKGSGLVRIRNYMY